MATANVLGLGVNYSWANAQIILFGLPLTGITKIEFKAKQNKENNYGVGVDPIGRGYANKEYDGTISVYSEEFFQWVTAVSTGDIMDIPWFDFPMVLTPINGRAIIPRKAVVRAAEFLESPFTVSQGDAKIMIDIPLIIGKIDWK